MLDKYTVRIFIHCCAVEYMSLWVLARHVHDRYVAHVCSCVLSTVQYSYVVHEDIHKLMRIFMRIFVRLFMRI